MASRSLYLNTSVCKEWRLFALYNFSEFQGYSTNSECAFFIETAVDQEILYWCIGILHMQVRDPKSEIRLFHATFGQLQLAP